MKWSSGHGIWDIRFLLASFGLWVSDNTEGNVSEITPMAGQRKPLRHQATKVEAADQRANAGVAGVASAAMRRPINVKLLRLAPVVAVDL